MQCSSRPRFDGNFEEVTCLVLKPAGLLAARKNRHASVIKTGARPSSSPDKPGVRTHNCCPALLNPTFGLWFVCPLFDRIEGQGQGVDAFLQEKSTYPSAAASTPTPAAPGAATRGTQYTAGSSPCVLAARLSRGERCVGERGCFEYYCGSSCTYLAPWANSAESGDDGQHRCAALSAGRLPVSLLHCFLWCVASSAPCM